MFLYDYDTERYCRACYNYWRFCDCVCDLNIDVANPSEDDGKEPASESDELEPLPSDPDVEIEVPPSKPFVFTAGADPKPDKKPVTVYKPIANRPSPNKKRPRPPPGDILGIPGLKPPPKEARPSKISKQPDPVKGDPVVNDIDHLKDLNGDGKISDYEELQYQRKEYDDLNDVEDVDSDIVTPEEANEIMKDVLNGEDYNMPDATFTLPSITKLGMGGLMYTRGRTPSAEFLQRSPTVPQYYGETLDDNGEITEDYQDWYEFTFVPWYETDATPNEKTALTGVLCVDPPPPNGDVTMEGLLPIYVHFRNDYTKGDYWSWKDKNGKIQEKRGSPPSLLEIFFPERFDTFYPNTLSDTTRSISLRNAYVFPDAWNDIPSEGLEYSVPESIPIDIVLPDLPSNPSVTTISSGTGRPDSIAYGQRLGNSVCWKYSTYQVTGRYASQLQTLCCEREGLIFYTPNQRYFLTALASPHRTQIIVYNHLAPSQLNTALHGIVRIGFESWMPYGISTSPENVISDEPNWKIKVTTADNTVLPLCSNFPTDINNIVLIPADVNGFSTFTTAVLEFGIYITNLNNDKFGNATPYFIVEYSNYRNNSQGNHTFLSHVDPFRRITTITPSFEADTTAPDTINYNYLGTTYPVTPCDSDKMVKIGEFSDQTGQDISDLFSKLWILPSYNPYTLTFSTGTTSIVESCPAPILNPPWIIIPNIGFRVVNGKNGKRVVGTWDSSLVGKYIHLVREQHLNIKPY